MSSLALSASACGGEPTVSPGDVRGADTSASRPAHPGGTIAVTGGSLQAERQIVLISPASGRIRRVRAPDDVVRFDLSPDGRRIAVTGFEGIWVLRRDGSRPRRIVALVIDEDHRLGAGEISWAPGGGRLVFARSDDTLFTVSAEGTDRRELVARADQPDWSPRGGEIVFVRNPERSSRLGVISAIRSDGRGVGRVVTQGRWGNPSVSPDGATVAFSSGRGIYVAPMKGGRPRLVARPGAAPEWSPDGRYLAFTRATSCGHAACSGRVFIMPARGGKARPYGPTIGDIGPLSWSR